MQDEVEKKYLLEANVMGMKMIENGYSILAIEKRLKRFGYIAEITTFNSMLASENTRPKFLNPFVYKPTKWEKIKKFLGGKR